MVIVGDIVRDGEIERVREREGEGLIVRIR